MTYPSGDRLRSLRRRNMLRDLLPYLLYATGSIFFVLGSAAVIGQKLGWW